MIAGLALLFATLIVRGASRNRHVRGRLLVSAVVFAVYAAIAAALAYNQVTESMRPRLDLVQPLLAAFAVINAFIALALNPFAVSRVPDRYPTIVQDTIVIALFALAAVFYLQDRIFAMTAAGAVVLGLALQDTLGNLFAGLAIQIEKPFRVGHWVSVAGVDGLVSEITWRATKLRTKAGNFVVVPNSMLSRDTIVNYSDPTTETRIAIDVGVSYDASPNEVKAVILAALKDEPLLSPVRGAEVMLLDFGASAITYRIFAWTTDFGADELLIDRVRTLVFYALKRARMAIPYPIQVEMSPEEAAMAPPDPASADRALRAVAIFDALTDDQYGELARSARRSVYAAGERMVRQGDPGSSMFVVIDGEAVVKLEPSGQEVAKIGAGGFFGEMSLLTGAPRNASVVATRDTDVLEITADALRAFVLANPAVVEKVGMAVSARQAELDRHRAAGAAAAPGEAPHSFLARMRRFLRLTGSSAG